MSRTDDILEYHNSIILFSIKINLLSYYFFYQKLDVVYFVDLVFIFANNEESKLLLLIISKQKAKNQ